MQSDAGSPAVIICLVEAVEYMFLVFRKDADSGVRHLYAKLQLLFPLYRE